MIRQKSLTRHDLRRLETRQALMEAAERIVLNQGISALTADTLAEEANVSRRSIFNHFVSVHDAIYARLNEYLTEFRSEYSPRHSMAVEGFEGDLLREIRRVITLENIEKYLHPVVSVGIKLTGGRIGPDSWYSELTLRLSRQYYELTREAFPHTHPLHLKVLVNLLLSIIEGGMELWIDTYFRAQDSGEDLPTMRDLHDYIHEGFDYVQHFIDGASPPRD